MNINQTEAKKVVRENWLFALIAMQPVLDAIAYWSQDSIATIAGYLRLVIMLSMALHLLITLKNKKKFIFAMCAIAAVCAVHILNTVRVGAIDVVFDISYIAKIAQAPILAVCFCCYIGNEKMKNQAVKGVIAAAVINVITIIIALATDTWNSTYGGGIGLSGWVIDDNRCANSIIFVSLSTFAVYVASVSQKKIINIALPVLVWVMLIANGTKACYMSLFAILIGFALFMLLRRLIGGEKIKVCFVVTLLLLAVMAVLVYPYSPRYIVDESLRKVQSERQNELDLKLYEMGYDPYAMTFEEKFNNPEVRDVFEEYYYKMMGYVIPDLFERFGMERVLIHYGMTSDMEMLINTRILKRTYAQFILEEYDSLTKWTGFEISEIYYPACYDLENDYHALYYFTGYIGLSAYALYVLYFIYLIIKRLITDFKGSFTMLNCCLVICYLLQLGLAHFSGAVFRRPNVSVYMAIVQALIYYQTVILPVNAEKKELV